MGKGKDIFRIHFRTTVSAFHKFEREIEKSRGLIDSRTLLILAPEIHRFEIALRAEGLFHRLSSLQ